MNFSYKDFPEADLVLKTCDDVHLYVHRLVLKLASPLFEDMSNLPQPFPSSTNEPIAVTEDAETMRQVITLIYPCSPDSHMEQIKAMSLARQVLLLQTSMKYTFDSLTTKLANVLAERANRVPEDAFTIFAVARVRDLPELAQKAAAACLKLGQSELQLPLFNNYSENQEGIQSSCEEVSLAADLGQFSAAEYQRLLLFYRRRMAANKTLLAPFSLRATTPEWEESKQTSERRFCDRQFESLVWRFITQELEIHGPDIRRLLDLDFLDALLRQHGKHAICSYCDIYTRSGRKRKELVQYVNAAEAELPGFGAGDNI